MLGVGRKGQVGKKGERKREEREAVHEDAHAADEYLPAAQAVK